MPIHSQSEVQDLLGTNLALRFRQRKHRSYSFAVMREGDVRERWLAIFSNEFRKMKGIQSMNSDLISRDQV